jgi:hypothetical protein
MWKMKTSPWSKSRRESKKRRRRNPEKRKIKRKCQLLKKYLKDATRTATLFTALRRTKVEMTIWSEICSQSWRKPRSFRK